MKFHNRESPTNVCEKMFQMESNEGYLVIFLLHSCSFLLFPKKTKDGESKSKLRNTKVTR